MIAKKNAELAMAPKRSQTEKVSDLNLIVC